MLGCDSDASRGSCTRLGDCGLGERKGGLSVDGPAHAPPLLGETGSRERTAAAGEVQALALPLLLPASRASSDCGGWDCCGRCCCALLVWACRRVWEGDQAAKVELAERSADSALSELRLLPRSTRSLLDSLPVACRVAASCSSELASRLPPLITRLSRARLAA